MLSHITHHFYHFSIVLSQIKKIILTMFKNYWRESNKNQNRVRVLLHWSFTSRATLIYRPFQSAVYTYENTWKSICLSLSIYRMISNSDAAPPSHIRQSSENLYHYRKRAVYFQQFIGSIWQMPFYFFLMGMQSAFSTSRYLKKYLQISLF